MVAILLVPQAIAYAYLAGMPPEYGLYAALIPIVLYAFFGTSPHLAIGPVAISALLITAGVSQLAVPFSKEYIQLAILAGLLIGAVQLILGLLKMGKYINLLSYPVITGFTSAASIIVIVSQMKDVLSIDIPRFEYFHETAIHTINNIKETHLLTLGIAGGSLLLIFLLRRISKKIPAGLVAVTLGIAISYFLDLEARGVDIIGFVPPGLPSFGMPVISFDTIISLIPTVLMVSIIGIIESIGIAKAIQNKSKTYEVSTNQELIALGISKIGGSFFNALPSSGSFSRSALLYNTKAKTTIASLITVVFVILALLFLTPLLFYLPKVILAVIIIYAVKNLFEYQLAKRLLKVHTFDFIIMVITFFITLLVSIEIGVGVGFLASFIILFYSKSSILKGIGKTFSQNYKNEIFFERDANSNTSALLKIKDNLHFGNVHFFKKLVQNRLAKEQEITNINFQFDPDIDMDSSAIKSLNEVLKFLNSNKVEYSLSNFNQKLEKRLRGSNVDIH